MEQMSLYLILCEHFQTQPGLVFFKKLKYGCQIFQMTCLYVLGDPFSVWLSSACFVYILIRANHKLLDECVISQA